MRRHAAWATAVAVAAASGYATGHHTAPRPPAPKPSAVWTPPASEPGGDLGVSCGIERWPVKTGTDPAAHTLDLTPKPTTIAALIAPTAPSAPGQATRYGPSETTVWQLTASVTSYKEEADKDVHLALVDAQGRTMIAEIPAPSCVAAGSPFGFGIASARLSWLAQHPVTANYVDLKPPQSVTLTGVGFFDKLHGQRGVAPNGIELHPVLSIRSAP